MINFESLGWLYDDCVNIAKNYSLPPGRGAVKPKIFPKNHGLRVAWFQSWTPNSLSDHAIIIEDDLEVSPLWFSWLRRSWLTYGHRTDLAGIALSRQYMVVQVQCNPPPKKKNANSKTILNVI